MRIAIMQPYFLPYIGYYQLISAVDAFVVYDNIKYTKKGWINRNRILVGGKDAYITLPLKSDSDSLDIRDRQLAAEFNRGKLINQINGAYAKAPHMKAVRPLLEQVVLFPQDNLFDFIHHAIVATSKILGIKTKLIVSSTISADHTLEGEDRVIAICRALGAKTYINPIGGTSLYDPQHFTDAGLDLRFHRARPTEYKQGNNPFVPWLSIMDVMMFNPAEDIGSRLLPAFDILERHEVQPTALP